MQSSRSPIRNENPPEYTNRQGGMTLKQGENFLKPYSDCLFSITFGNMFVFTQNIFKLAKENTPEQDQLLRQETEQCV